MAEIGIWLVACFQSICIFIYMTVFNVKNVKTVHLDVNHYLQSNPGHISSEINPSVFKHTIHSFFTREQHSTNFS